MGGKRPITALLAPATAAALVALAACAPDHFRAVGGAAFIRVEGQVGLQDSAGSLTLNSNMNDLRDDLRTGRTEASPYLRFEADWGPQRVRASGFGHDSSGVGALSGDFGDIPAGTAVETSTDFLNITGSWSYDLAPGATWRLAPGVQLGYYALDITTRAASISATERVQTDVLVPMPCVEAAVDLGAVEFEVNAGLMSARLGDANGRYWDAEALARIRPAEGFELIGGFRYLLIDAHGTASGRDFDADLDVFGFFLGGGYAF